MNQLMRSIQHGVCSHTSGPNPQRKERGSLQCALSSKKEIILVVLKLSGALFQSHGGRDISSLATGNPVTEIPSYIELFNPQLFKDGGGGDEHVGPDSHKFTRMAKFYKMAKRDYVGDDLQMLKITMSNTSSRNQAQSRINVHYNILAGGLSKGRAHD
ncbi:hypothetical protein Tco_0221235 [Tanacetum coccineum]